MRENGLLYEAYPNSIYFTNTTNLGNINGEGVGLATQHDSRKDAERTVSGYLNTIEQRKASLNSIYIKFGKMDEDGYRDYDNGIPCTPVSVPGAVWYLFRGRSDQDVMDYIKGKRLSKSFMI